jgi:hypothetical protein
MNCMHCTATTNGVSLCAKCRQTLSVSLVNLASYHTDVLRIRPGERVKVRSAYQSTPPSSLNKAVHDKISDAADKVDNMLSTWCRTFVDDRPQVGQAPLGAVKQCGWLEGHLSTIVTLEWAAELLKDSIASERELQRILDQADTGWYAGKCGYVLAEERPHDQTTCGCGCHVHGWCDIDGGCDPTADVIPAVVCERGLYATPGHAWIRCPECGMNHPVQERREKMKREAEDENAPIRVIAKVMVGLIDGEHSEERLTRRIEQWVHRDKLRDLGVRVIDGRPRRVYRIGDVLKLIEREKPPVVPEAC